MTTLGPLSALADDLAAGRTTSRQLIETCLDRAADAGGQGGVAFISIDADRARADADAADAARAAGRAPSRFAGLPVSIKDLFDIAGEVTRAGSVALNDAPPATADAPSVARLKAAGFIAFGRTNMTEFAYSGLGLNPHHGDPRAPYERAVGRASGGSTSGGAVSVADGMAAAALGSDTGGSCRIPAAFCGLTGYKPTAASVPLAGAYPLSDSLDSIGSIAPGVACVAALHGVLSGGPALDPAPIPLQGARLAVLRNYVLEDLAPEVAAAFEAALRRLAASGAEISDVTLPDLDRLPELNARGGIVAAEAYRHHRALMATAGDRYDPRVISRIAKAETQEPGEYERLIAERQVMIRRANETTAPFAAILAPTAPILPPRLSDLADDAEYGRVNLLALRNPTVANMLDRCSVSLPSTAQGEAPVGLMLIGPNGGDAALLGLAKSVEEALGVVG